MLLQALILIGIGLVIKRNLKYENKNLVSIYTHRNFVTEYDYVDRYISLIDAQGYAGAGFLILHKKSIFLSFNYGICKIPFWDRYDETIGPMRFALKKFDKKFTPTGVIWLAKYMSVLYIVEAEETFDIDGGIWITDIDDHYLDLRTKDILNILYRKREFRFLNGLYKVK